MRYSVEQYATSLYEALKDKTGRERTATLDNFTRLLRRRGDYGRLDQILRRYEALAIAREGKVKVHIEAPEEPTESLKHSIERALGRKAVFSERTDPGLLAGLRLVVNDSIVIDATAKTRLEKLFARM